MNRAQRIVLAFFASVVIAGVVATSGCASAPREVDLPPLTLTEAPTSTAAEEAALVAAPEREAPTDPAPHAADAEPEPESQPGAGRRHTIVIQSAADHSEVTPRSLQEASTSERERRAQAEAPVVVITNSNLAELAEGVELTVLGEPAPAAGATGAASPSASTAGGTATGGSAAAGAAAGGAPKAPSEEYWRSQALKLRLDWKAAVETIDELESEVQELRRRFYEEDDPFYRDNQIKPAWDRSLDLLAAAKAGAEEHERRLERFLEEGRAAGALPGWLREGVEFEPPATAERTPAERRRSDDPWEPRILNEDPRDP